MGGWIPRARELRKNLTAFWKALESEIEHTLQPASIFRIDKPE